MNNNIVYCHLNKINGKRYIGITSQKPEDRWKNGTHYEHNQHFSNAIKKYGWENFEHLILHTNLSREEASNKEKYYIKLFDTLNPEKGYNLTAGGSHSFTLSPEGLQKIREAGKKNKGKKRTEEQKTKISNETKKAMNKESMKTKMRTIYDSEEWRKKNSESTKRQWENGSLRKAVSKANGKQVKCIETGKKYLSMSIAEKETGISRKAISACCNKKRDSVQNLHWEFIKY